jgi:hypothetical protein
VVEFCAALLSLPTTVIVFGPGLSATDRLQLAVADPVAVPPLAATPFTVTEEIPLSPSPESLAVPDTVIGLAVTVWLFVWLVIATDGAVLSGGGAPPTAVFMSV